jgi:hypothetical protein
MSSWGNNDNAANTPFWSATQVNLKPDITNATALYLNSVPNYFKTTLADGSERNANKAVGLFLVDSTEEHAGSDNITDVSLITGGTGYLEVPTVAFSGGGGASAAATASIGGGAVTQVLITNTGSSYETVPTVTIQAPRITIAGTITQATDTIPYTGHGLAVDEAVKYYHGGGVCVEGGGGWWNFIHICCKQSDRKIATSTVRCSA